MQETKTITAIADLIKAHGGASFARGYIDGTTGDGFNAPNLQHDPDYSRGYISSCDILRLVWLARHGAPNGGSDWWSGVPAIEIRHELLKHID